MHRQLRKFCELHSCESLKIFYYYFVCAVGGQYDMHLPFWLPGFVKLIML